MKEIKKEEVEIIRENFKFVWKNEHDKNQNSKNDLTKQYYDTLFKEYCIADLSLFKEGKIGLRWCSETDILKGKGSAICGNSICEITKELKPFEVNMSYRENMKNKNALVKLYLCYRCGKMLNKSYKYLKKKRKREKEKMKK